MAILDDRLAEQDPSLVSLSALSRLRMSNWDLRPSCDFMRAPQSAKVFGQTIGKATVEDTGRHGGDHGAQVWREIEVIRLREVPGWGATALALCSLNISRA